MTMVYAPNSEYMLTPTVMPTNICVDHVALQYSMAAVAADKDDVIFIIESVVRGHHIYKKVWTPK